MESITKNRQSPDTLRAMAARAYGVALGAIDEHAACLGEVTHPQFVQWDLWDGNVMVRDGTIVGVLNHERAFYGGPLIEHGFNGTALPAFGDPAAFVRGYGRAELNAVGRRRNKALAVGGTSGRRCRGSF